MPVHRMSATTTKAQHLWAKLISTGRVNSGGTIRPNERGKSGMARPLLVCRINAPSAVIVLRLRFRLSSRRTVLCDHSLDVKTAIEMIRQKKIWASPAWATETGVGS